MLAHSAAAHPGDTQLPSWSGSLYLAERERERENLVHGREARGLNGRRRRSAVVIGAGEVRSFVMDAKQEGSTEDVEGVRS